MNSIVKVIALDLDGTLLTSDKKLSERNLKALQRAAEAGIQVVPTTGRFYGMMPEVIRNLDFIRYVITINGAQVYDLQDQKVISRNEMPLDEVISIMNYLDNFDLIYDAYVENTAWMSRDMWNKSDEYAPDEHYRKLIKDFRTPVDDLKQYLKDLGHDIQKTQFFVKDYSLRDRLLKEIPSIFPSLSVSSSLANNVEINCEDANKGRALQNLCSYLGYTSSNAMSFGDGLNDLPMIKEAGCGVAMSNSCPEVLAAADYISCSNDEDGVAAAIDKLIFGE